MNVVVGRNVVGGRLLGVIAGCAISLVVGCADPLLGRAAFVGASATVGYGAEADGSEGTVPVDLAVVYEATVRPRVRESIRLGDGAFYARPDEAAREQIDALLGERPTVVFALDWLFWSVYGAVDAERAADQRAARVGTALGELARLDERRVPIVLGTVPRLPDDVEFAMFTAVRREVSAAEFDAIDAVVDAWAAARPWVVLVPLGSIFDAARDPAAPATLLQPDGVHPTTDGLLLLVQRAFGALVESGLVETGSWHGDPDIVRARLAERSERALASGRAGWLDVAIAERAYRAATEALEAGDCRRAAAEAERLLALARRFDRDPTGIGMGSWFASTVASELIRSCPEHAIVVRRAAESFGLDARRARPNPFRLELWIELASLLDRDLEIIERMSALAETLEIEEIAVGGIYASAFRDAVRSYRAIDTRATRDAAIARRAHVARAYGGAERLHAVGRVAVEAAVVAAHDPRLTAIRERVAARSDGAPLLEPFPPPRDALLAFSAAVSAVWQVSTIRRDLIAAGAPERAADLGTELEAGLGPGLAALLAARDVMSVTDRLLPPWSIRTIGHLDTDAEVANRLGSDPDPRLESGVRAQTAFPMTLRSVVAPAPDVGTATVGIGNLLPAGTEIDAPAAPTIGLFTHLDGRTIVSRVEGDLLDHRVFDPAAPESDHRFRTGRSSVARASTWRTVGAPTEVVDLETLEALIWRTARDAGIETMWPMPFVVEIDATRVDARVVDRPIVGVSGRVEIVGVFAPAQVGRLVRPGRATQAHVVWTAIDGTPATGELTGIAGTAVGLRLPE